MNYRQTFGNRNFVIRVSTDRAEILRLIRRQLDYQDFGCGPARLTIRLEIVSARESRSGAADRFLYRDTLEDRSGWVSSYGVRAASVRTDPRNNLIRSTVYADGHPFQERLYDFLVTRPLYFLLARRGFYFVHASAVVGGGGCVLVSGDQHSGKTTVALALAAAGGRLMADDDCFVRMTAGAPLVYGIPTKVGLKSHHYRMFPALKTGASRHEWFGGKRRVSARNVTDYRGGGTVRCAAILYPRYRSAARSVRLRPVTQRSALERLVDSSYRPYPERLRAAAARNFLALYELTRAAEGYELIYNDTLLDEIAPAVRSLGLLPGAGSFRRPS